MKKFYNTLIFIGCFLTIKQLNMQIFSFISNFFHTEWELLVIGSFKTAILTAITFLAGCLYSKLFKEMLTLKKSISIIFTTRLLDILLYIVSNQRLSTLGSGINLTLPSVLLWSLSMIFFILIFRSGGIFYFKRRLVHSNAWVLGIYIAIVNAFIIALFCPILLVDNNTLHLGFLLGVFGCIPILFGFCYSRTYQEDLLFSDSIKTMSVFFIVFIIMASLQEKTFNIIGSSLSCAFITLISAGLLKCGSILYLRYFNNSKKLSDISDNANSLQF